MKLTDKLKNFVKTTLGISDGDGGDTIRRKHFVNLLVNKCNKDDPIDSLNKVLDVVTNSFSDKIASMITFRRTYMSQDNMQLH